MCLIEWLKGSPLEAISPKEVEPCNVAIANRGIQRRTAGIDINVTIVEEPLLNGETAHSIDIDSLIY